MSFSKFHHLSVLLILFLLIVLTISAQAQTGFTYSGKLSPTTNGSYDFKFTLYTDATAGSAVGSPITVNSVAVSSGNYTVTLNFGATSFADAPLWMQIADRKSGTTIFTNVKGRVLETSRFSLLSLLSENALAIGGYPVSSAAPASGQALVWNGSAWAPATVSGGQTYQAGAGLSLNGNVFSIANAGVVGSMLAAGAVTAPAIASGAVTSSAIAAGAVTSSALANSAVTTAALADGAVTASKISLPLALSGSTGAQSPVVQVTNSGSGIAIKGVSNTSSGYGLSGSSANGVGGHFDGSIGVYSDGVSEGVYGFASAGPGVMGESSATGSYGGYFDNNNGSGIYASSTNTFGDGGDFYGELNGIFASGTAPGSYGVSAISYGDADGVAVSGNSGAYGYGIYGSSPSGVAGGFNGNVSVTGTLTAGAKNFKIDHPLDPANKYLLHSCVESADMKNLYDGMITLDAGGQAIVELPDWFEALNKDFRYQLTCIGGFAPVYIAQEIQNNRFQIAGGRPGMKISWQVTGVRQDAYAIAHPLEVEQDKPQDKKGKFLHPKELGYPESMGEDYEMRQRLEQRHAAPTPAQGR
ncbi:MAG TPA: hypothetical protein VKT32_11085 [Chthonomonadaceae bacterium]|nr:hypothetical protein [Chthonomonadaceae bacterium]